MIAYLRGQILEVGSETALMDVGGVGYEMHCSVNTLAAFNPGEELALSVYTNVREDAIELFGFATRAEKQLFLQLMKVNGIGPRMAIKIISGAPIDRIAEMVEAGDVKGLSGLPKVGKKTAEQMILTLKGKLVLDDSGSSSQKTGSGKATVSKPRTEISSALVHLGFRPQDVERVVSEFEADVQFEDGVRRGLAALSSI